MFSNNDGREQHDADRLDEYLAALAGDSAALLPDDLDPGVASAARYLVRTGRIPDPDPAFVAALESRLLAQITGTAAIEHADRSAEEQDPANLRDLRARPGTPLPSALTTPDRTPRPYARRDTELESSASEGRAIIFAYDKRSVRWRGRVWRWSRPLAVAAVFLLICGVLVATLHPAARPQPGAPRAQLPRAHLPGVDVQAMGGLGQLAFSWAGRMYLLDGDAGALYALPDQNGGSDAGAAYAAWSPDGQWVAYLARTRGGGTGPKCGSRGWMGVTP